MTRHTPSLAQQAADAPAAGTATLGWLLGVVRRRILLFVAIVAGCAALALVAGLLMPPRYMASARLILDARQQNVLATPQVLSGLAADPAAIDSQVEVLKSRALARQVVDRFDLARDPEFNRPAGHLGLRGRLLGAQPDAGPPSTERVVDAVLDHLTVGSLGLSSVIQVSFRAPRPAEAAALANAFADAYVADQVAQKAGANARATAWLRSRLDQLRANAEQSDAALRRYQVATGLVSTQSSAGATAGQQAIQSLTTELSTAKADQATAEARLGAASAAGDRAANQDTLDSPVIQALKKQRAEIGARLSELTTRYGPRYPDVVAQTRQLDDVNARLAGETGQILRGLGTQAQAARTRTAKLQAQLDAANGSLKTANLASVGANQLQNRADADKAVYQAFLDRYKAVSAQSGVERSDARVISYAVPPLRPSTPGLKLVVALGLLFGTAVAIAAITLLEVTRGGVYGADQLSDAFGLPCLGLVPNPASVRPRGAGPATPLVDLPVAEPASVVAEMVRAITNAGPFAPRYRDGRVVMLSSALPGEGKSTTAVLLARTLAGLGVRTLLVDCDLVRRTATRLMPGEPDAGVVELVDGKAVPEEALLPDPHSPLAWIGLRADSRRTQVFGNPEVAPLLAELKRRFQVVILDAGPVLATADARALALEADSLVLVVRWARTRRGAVRAALKLLGGLGVAVDGAILSQVDLRRQARMGDAGAYGHGAQYLAYVD